MCVNVCIPHLETATSLSERLPHAVFICRIPCFNFCIPNLETGILWLNLFTMCLTDRSPELETAMTVEFPSKSLKNMLSTVDASLVDILKVSSVPDGWILISALM